MATQDQVIELNRLHPDWTVRQIADYLGASDSHIRAVKRRNRLKIPLAFGRQKWTPELIKLARKLLDEQVGSDAFKEAVGFSKGAAYAKLFRESVPPAQVSVKSAPKVPDHVWEERNRRLMAPRSLTAILMGDPAQ